MITSDVGSLVPPENAEAMAREAIAIANGDRELLSVNARKRAHDLFSVESMYAKTNAVYHQLLGLK